MVASPENPELLFPYGEGFWIGRYVSRTGALSQPGHLLLVLGIGKLGRKGSNASVIDCELGIGFGEAEHPALIGRQGASFPCRLTGDLLREEPLGLTCDVNIDNAQLVWTAA